MAKAVVRIFENGTSLLVAQEYGGDDVCHHLNAATVCKAMLSTDLLGQTGVRRISTWYRVTRVCLPELPVLDIVNANPLRRHIIISPSLFEPH